MCSVQGFHPTVHHQHLTSSHLMSSDLPRTKNIKKKICETTERIPNISASPLSRFSNHNKSNNWYMGQQRVVYFFLIKSKSNTAAFNDRRMLPIVLHCLAYFWSIPEFPICQRFYVLIQHHPVLLVTQLEKIITIDVFDGILNFSS